MVSGRQCTSIKKDSNEMLTCKLPPGSGSSLTLIVKAGSQRTESRGRVTYASPSITEIRGCQQISMTAINECNRYGGDRIMLRGDNFGNSGATISIGGLTCTNVTHTATDPHREVLCTTPADASLDRAVTLLQRYGDISRETILLSYVQCPPGQRNDDYRCVACVPGYSNDLWSQALCRQCQPGYYSNSSGAANCSPCPTGTYSGLGYQECVRCPRGTFAQERAEACLQCAPGTYAAREGSSQCEACPLGAEHTSDYSYCQCKAGSYKDAHGVCQSCMLGGDCLQAGTTVYNVMSLDYYSPSVTFKGLPSVVRFSFPVRVNANVPANDARRNALALAVKALFDEADRPRNRFEFVSADLETITAAVRSTVYPNSHTPRSTNVDLFSVYIITVDVLPPEHDGEEETSRLVASAVLHLSVANSVLTQELAFVDKPTVDNKYYRHAITSFEYCLSNTCQPGSKCAEGHTGPLCSVCLPGYGKDSVFKCGRCNEPALAWFILIAGTLAAIVGCGILAWKQITDGKQSMNELPAPAVPLLLKVAMTGLQVMSIASRYDLKWPGVLDGLFNGADTAAGVGTAMLSLDCFLGDSPSVKPFWVTSIGIMALPLFGVILPLLFFAPRYFSVKRGYKKLVLSEVAEQRRLMIEIVAQYEDFRRQREKATVVQGRAAQHVQDERELKVGLWDHVVDEDNLGILSKRETGATLGIENDAHVGIDLSIKQSAQSELEHARRTQDKRRQRRVPKSRFFYTQGDTRIRTDLTDNTTATHNPDTMSGPLAPPKQPPNPECSISRLSSTVIDTPRNTVDISSGLHNKPIVRLEVGSSNAFFGSENARSQPDRTSSPHCGIRTDVMRRKTFDCARHHSTKLTHSSSEASRVVAPDNFIAATAGNTRAAERLRTTKPYQFGVATPSGLAHGSSLDMVQSDIHSGPLNGSDAVTRYEDDFDQEPLHVTFDANHLVESESENDATSTSASTTMPDQSVVEAHDALKPAKEVAVREAIIENIDNNEDKVQEIENHAANVVDADTPFVAEIENQVDRAVDDTAFVFQRSIINDTNVSELALSNAFMFSNENRETIFERTAQEVEMYATIVAGVSTFDDNTRLRSEASARTTEEFAKVVQSAEDLENMRFLARLPFETLYDAELLRERVLRRERAFQRMRAESQATWYVQNYGKKSGKALFEKERAKRLKAEPPKLTAAEMRVRVSVAESLYNQILPEFSGYVITTITVVMLMIHPNVTRQFFTVLSCKNVGGTVDPSASVVLGEMLEPCYSSQHILFIVAIGMPMLILWVLGIPFFAWLVLYRNRDLVMTPAQGASATMRNKKKVFESQMAFLYRGYKPTRYYWFLMEMARKVFLVAISVFFPGALHTQLMLAALLIFACILAQIAAKPFENRIPEFVELFSLFTSFMIFFLANFLFVSTVGDTSQFVITVLICMLVVMFIAIVVVAFFMLSKEEAQLSPLRNALRKAHAQGHESGPIVRAWRIEMARARRARDGTVEKMKSPDAASDASVFTIAVSGANKLRSEAAKMKALNEDARTGDDGAATTNVHSFDIRNGAHSKDSATRMEEAAMTLTNAQRGARLAMLLEQGQDVTTTGFVSTLPPTLSADESAAAVIADATRHCHMESRAAKKTPDLDLTSVLSSEYAVRGWQ